MSKDLWDGNPLVGASIGIGMEALKDFVRLNLGNVVLTSLPDSREEAAEVLTFCREHKIYIMLSEVVHRHNHRRWYAPSLDKKTLEDLLALAGKYFLGRYVIGESGGILYWPKFYTINEGVRAYGNMPSAANDAEAHQNYVDYLKKEIAFERNEICDCKFYNVESSIVFSTHTEAGIQGQCLELLPGDPLITLSAIRGAARGADQNWGVHIAQLYYGGMRCDRMYMHRWRASLYLSYMAGAEFIYPESGHFQYMVKNEPNYGFHDEPIRRFRDELRQLYRLSLIHRRPAGGPASPIALVRGADDGHPGIWNPYAWGVYENGEKWESADGERGWELYNTFYRRDALFSEYNTGDHDFSGNPPGGQLDIIPRDADFSAHKMLIFPGVNRMDEALYAKLQDYVRNGGHLLIALSHFDNSAERGARERQLFRDGRIHELCGFDVEGRADSDVFGMQVIRRSSDPAYDLPLKNCSPDPNFNGHLTAVTISDLQPETQVLAGLRNTPFASPEETARRPLLVEHRLGKGMVFTLTTEEAPGCAALRDFAKNILYMAMRVHRTELDMIAGDRVRYAVYPDGEDCRFYCYNSDPDLTQAARIFYRGKCCGEILLRAGEFRSGLVSGGVILLPEDPLWEVEKSAINSFTLVTAAQEVTLFNPSDEVRAITVNGIAQSMEPGGKCTLRIPAYIPEDRKALFDPAFLREEPVEMHDLSTPY